MMIGAVFFFFCSMATKAMCAKRQSEREARCASAERTSLSPGGPGAGLQAPGYIFGVYDSFTNKLIVEN